MKSDATPTLFFSMYPLKAQNQEPSSNSRPQSPYLKAILTGKAGLPNPGAIVRLIDSDRLAALRYIKETMWRNKNRRG